MKKIEGKFGAATIYTDNVEEMALGQIQELCDQEFIEGSQIRIMPDTHAGKGCVIGTTMTITDKIVPNLVGVDVGCGMRVTKLDLQAEDVDFEKVDDLIMSKIPHGFGIRGRTHALTNQLRLGDLRLPIQNLDRILKSLGTLGGGNHFIELNVDSEGYVYLVIHSGSRNLGKQVAEHYQNHAHKVLSSKRNDQHKLIQELKMQGRTSEIQHVISEMKKPKIDKSLAYLEGDDFHDYLHDMKIAQEFASLNRQAMSEEIISGMGWNVLESWESIHNFIDMEHMILRKGATSAQAKERLLIPINMRDGSIIAKGKGNPDWNFSAPHGAGRLMSRKKAFQTLDLSDFEQTMSEVWSRSVVESTLDEAPMAYKPMQEILDNIQDTVEILEVIKPIYNFKSR